MIAANLLFQIAAVALAAAGLQDGIESTRPKVGDLESQYRQEHLDKDTETQEGDYFLRDTLLSGTWMICRLERTADVPKSEGSGIGGPSSKLPAAQSMEEWRKNSVIERHRTWSGLIAYDLETKRARELIPPPQARNSVLATWVTAFYSVAPARCAVVMSQVKPKNQYADAVAGQFLWEWDLGTNEVVARGPWTDASLLRLVLDPRLVKIVEQPPPDAEHTLYNLVERESGRSAQFSFSRKEPTLLEPDGAGFEGLDGLTLIPQSDGRSFIACEPRISGGREPSNPRAFECIDLKSKGGHRWTITISDLAKAAGGDITRFAPIRGVSPRVGRLLVSAHVCRSNDQCAEKLLVLDTTNGTCLNVCSLPDGVARTTDLIASSDARVVGFLDTTDLHKLALVIIDAEKGRILTRVPTDRQAPHLCSIDDQHRLLVLANSELSRLRLGKPPSIDRVFDLRSAVTGTPK